MASLVESHPQKQAIIDALLSGESTRSIAARVEPPLSDTCIWKFKRTVIAPAISRSIYKIQQLKGASVLPEASASVASVMQHPIVQRNQAIAEANHATLSAPFIARMEKKYLAYDKLREKALNPAEGEPDIKAYSALDAAETRSMDFHARLVGAIAPAQQESTQTLNLMVVLPRPGDEPTSTAASACIDITAEPA